MSLLKKRSIVIFAGIILICLCVYILLSKDKPKVLTETDLKDSAWMETLWQNDSRILNYIRQNHLRDPSPKEQLNLTLKKHSCSGGQKNLFKLVKKLLKNKRNGFFIEAGANDGEFLSNTLDFEMDFDWTGLLVEADPAIFPDLIKTQRNAWISDACLSISPFPIQLEMRRTNQIKGISHLKKTGEGMFGDFPGAKDWTSFQVQCFPLYSILLSVGVTSVDYFSLDIEGAEIGVLKTIPWDALLIKVISIEVHAGKEEPTKDFMLAHDFKFVQYVADVCTHDLVFVHSSLHL